LAMKINTDLFDGKLFLNYNFLTNKKGDISENKVKMALERLKRRKRIINYIHASKIKVLNKQGIDFIIIIIKKACYTTVPLQVKSSWIGMIEHNKITKQKWKKNKMFNGIPAIIVNERDSIEDLCVKILRLINKSIKS